MLKLLSWKYASSLALVCILALFCSCQRESASERVVREWMGKELTIPNGLTFTVQGDTIAYDWQAADYRIVSLIDSAGCTGCKMKLPLWEKAMSILNSPDEASVALLMVVESADAPDIIGLSRTSGFNWPLAIDPIRQFSSSNPLPERQEFRTMLLDADNRVVAIGNPATNPSVLRLYQKVMFGDNAAIATDTDAFAPVRFKSLGASRPGQAASVVFEVINPTDSTLHVESIATSCDCTHASMSTDSIAPGQSCVLKVRHTAEPSANVGEYQREIMVTLRDVASPLVFKVSGHIIAN